MTMEDSQREENYSDETVEDMIVKSVSIPIRDVRVLAKLEEIGQSCS